MSTQTDELVDVETEENTGDDPSKQAHYYNITWNDFHQARANGTPIVALCGHRWVPMVNGPKDLPICPKCLAENVCMP